MGYSRPRNETNNANTPPSHKAILALPPASITPSTPSKNLFSYASPRNASGSLTPSRTPGSARAPNLNVRSEIYSLSPIRFDSQRILQGSRRQPRYVNKVPFKVLDAPDLADDFYLNLVDWGSSNILGVGLGSAVYMWDSMNGRVTKLCQLKDDTVTSVSWVQRVRTVVQTRKQPILTASAGNPPGCRDWQRFGADLGCRTVSSTSNNDGSHIPCWRSRLE